jgi:dCMP deaminase
MFNQKWDLRFLEQARQLSLWSKDTSTKVGAVIVRPDKTIASMGFNGFPKWMPDIPEFYQIREEKYSRIIHGEMNALIHARESVQGCILYTYPFAPCERCAVHMLQAGIIEFVFPSIPEGLKERWGNSIEKTKRYIEDCGAHYTEYKGESGEGTCSNIS